MNRRGVLLPLAAGILLLGIAGARAEDGKTVECSDTPLKFDAPGYDVSCKDLSEASMNAGEQSAALKAFTLHAMSKTEATFLDVVDYHVAGNTRIVYSAGSVQSDVERLFGAKFANWSKDSDIGGFEVARVSATFNNADPLDCIGFQRLGGHRWGGVGGMTVGLSCSVLGRDHAVEALKHFSGGGN